MPSSMTFAEHLPAILMAGGALILTMMTLLNLRSRVMRRRAAAAESPRDFIERVREEAGEKSEPVAVAAHPTSADLERTARRLIAQMDGRMAQLQELIRQADERLRLLDEACYRAPGASISPTRASAYDERQSSPSTASNGRATSSAAHTNGRAVNGADRPRRPQSPVARPMIVERPKPAVNRSIDDPALRTLDPLSANVYELADRGRTPVEIAQTLDEQVGKVELILALRTCST